MKKTLITFSLAAMLGMAVLMSACGVASKESNPIKSLETK